MDTPPPSGVAAATPRRRMLPWLAGWLVVTLGVLAFHARPAQTPLDVDEFYWIGSSYYYHLAFERGEWRHPDWRLFCPPARTRRWPSMCSGSVSTSPASPSRRPICSARSI